MKVSYRWLQRHVDLTGIGPDDVARDLTMHTAEVEGVEPFAPWLADVLVGHVTTREKHPDADKLSVCTVDVGDGEPLQIVCGAPNVDAGQRVAVAKVGTRLPGDFKIKKSKIRGVESRGMICSERELDLGDEHDGIWVLPADAAVGAPVAEAVGAVDWVIEIDNKSITHRPDLWGHRGIAAELAAIRGLELTPLDFSLPKTGDATPMPVRVESDACSRYLGLMIDGVGVRPSPTWLKLLLLAADQRPLDLLVDVSNFVMLDLGQPNHLFDRTTLSPEGICVRDARDGEAMVTLDGAERKLVGSDLLICSGDAPVALAGVMGGEGSKVGSETTQLLLEVATFHPTIVRRTATRLGLRSDASARFEKGLDPTLVDKATGHLVRLLAELEPGLSLPAPPADDGNWSDPTTSVPLRPERVRTLLGVDVEDDEIEATLSKLGFGVNRAGERWDVTVPAARAVKDVTIEEDLIEEVGRMVRYDRIAERPLEAEIVPLPRDRRFELVRKIQDRLAGAAAFHEALTYSFLPDELARAARCDELPHVELANPFAEGWQRMRRSVVPSLLGKLAQNLKLEDEVRLFEIGKGTLPEERDERGLPKAIHELALVWAAPRPGKQARFDAGVLQRLKGVVDDLVFALDLPALVWSKSDDVPGWAHPGRNATGRTDADSEPVGCIAQLEPKVARELGLDADVCAARISIDALVDDVGRRSGFRSLPRYPGIKIDVALALPEATPAAEVHAALERAGKGLVADVELFDVYSGEQVGPGKKSLAYHVVLQSPKGTLQDKDGQKFLTRVEREAQNLGGELRRE